MTRVTRRSFLAASAGALACPHFVRALGANDRLNIAYIGVGGRGAHNMGQFKGENVAVLCDIDRNYIEKARQSHKDARVETDFRKVFDKANGFDAVVVSSTEHTHAFATLPALQLGKHVYCEKPLTHGVWEARVIREAAAKTKVATQMGTQLHASDNFRRVVELIRANAVGPVREVHIWVSRAWGLQPAEQAAKSEDHNDFKAGGVNRMVGLDAMPTKAEAIPPHLEWDLWLGPAPARPYSSIYFPGPCWYRWWDFASGTMSDLGSHWNDLPFWALGLKAPLTIEGFGPPPHPHLTPASMSAKYEFPARGDMPAVTMHWYQGTMKPPVLAEKKLPRPNNGMLFIGDDGMILADYSTNKLLPEEKFRDYKRPPETIAKSLGHHAEWAHACKTGSPTLSNFEYAGWLTESNHLGSIAYRLGKKLVWDAANLKASNAPEADALIRREYRKGWNLT